MVTFVPVNISYNQQNSDIKIDYYYEIDGSFPVYKAIQANENTIISGLNETVVARVNESIVQTYSYEDYGKSSAKATGHGYNGEVVDETGLVYLRARYYDPSIARFIQIDNNYHGEQDQINTQNRYVYTLNNPYKYVDRDGNAASAGLTGVLGGIVGSGLSGKTPANGYMPSTWVTKSINLMDFKRTINSKLPAKYRRDAERYWFVKNNFNPNVVQYIKLIAEVYGPPAPELNKPVIIDNGKVGYSNSGGVTTNTNRPRKPLGTIEPECPLILTVKDWVDLLSGCFDWGMIVKDFQTEFVKQLFEVKTIEIIAKHAKGGKIKVGTVISAAKAKEVLKGINQLSKSNLQTISSTMTKNIGSDLLNSFKKGMTWVTIIINWISNVTGYVVNAFFEIISWFRAVGSMIGSALYLVFKEGVVTAVRLALTPFIGPFAWVVGLLVDYGFGPLNYLIDIEGVCNDIGEWILRNLYDSIQVVANTIGNLL